jgi:hypothetical protein
MHKDCHSAIKLSGILNFVKNIFPSSHSLDFFLNKVPIFLNNMQNLINSKFYSQIGIQLLNLLVNESLIFPLYYYPIS